MSDPSTEGDIDAADTAGTLSFKVLARGQSHVQEIFLVSSTEYIDSMESLALHMTQQLTKEKTKIILPKDKSIGPKVICHSSSVFRSLDK